MALDDLYLENIDEYVNDENRIVTYKWLSLTLQVHVNIAKQMLYKFVEEQRNNKDNDHLTVTYFVSGLAKADGDVAQVHRCAVVPEDGVESFKSSLVTVTSSHIYSVQKIKLKDSNVLYMTDYDILKEKILESNKFSAIQYGRAKLQSEEDLDFLRAAQTPIAASEPQQKSKPVTNGHAATKSPPKKGPGGIAGMFAKAEKKKEAATAAKTEDVKEEKEQKKLEAKATKAGVQTSKKQGGMMSFFSKQTEKPTASKEPVKKSEEKSKITDTKKKEDDKPPKTQEKGKSRKTLRKADSDDENKGQSKRRRIKEDLFDSSSEEEEMDVVEESPVPSPAREPSPDPESPVAVESDKEVTEEEELVPSRQEEVEEKKKGSNSGERRRRRKKKLVPKTYMDDDGYMVTEKVWESESTDASEVEEPVPKKPPSKPQPAAKTSPTNPKKKGSPQKKGSPSKATGKQTSLMSFFKKK